VGLRSLPLSPERGPEVTEKITIPSGQKELEELLADGSKVKSLMDGGQFNEVVAAYAKHVAKTDTDITKQIQDETQRVLASYLRESGDEAGVERLKSGGSVTKTARNSLYSPKAAGAKLDAHFEGLGDYFASIWHKNEGRPQYAAKQEAIRNASQSSGNPSGGGFLVPESLRSELLRLSLETAVVRPRARIVPMETSRIMYPILDSTSHATSVHGGVLGYWRAESAAFTESSATFGRIALEAFELTAYATVPNELMADSMLAFEAFINSAFPEALSYFEDDAFINGSGAGQPEGFLNASASVEVAKETGQAADTVVYENIVKMYSRMLPGSLNRAVWIVSPDVVPELLTMGLAIGTGGSAIFVQDATQPAPMTIFGRPVIVSEKVQNVGDAGDINFVDLSYYLIGDRQALTAESSPHYRFQNGETAFRFVTRVDGRPWLQSAITPRNGGATLSPFVKLAARA